MCQFTFIVLCCASIVLEAIFNSQIAFLGSNILLLALCSFLDFMYLAKVHWISFPCVLLGVIRGKKKIKTGVLDLLNSLPGMQTTAGEVVGEGGFMEFIFCLLDLTFSFLLCWINRWFITYNLYQDYLIGYWHLLKRRRLKLCTVILTFI